MDRGGERTAPWWIAAQGLTVGIVIAIAGYAWHDALKGRLPAAPRFALAALAVSAVGLAVMNARAEFIVFAVAAALALGWSLRLPRARERPVQPFLDVGLGLAFAAGATALALAWSGALRDGVFVGVAVLVAVRIVVVDPFIAWRERRGKRRLEAEPAGSDRVLRNVK
ncbi:MAG: hypothetical protein ACYDCK_00975 [Thermoplasmatota archaeon]